MTHQLNIFDTPPNNVDVEPTTADVKTLGPNEFFIAPFGRVKAAPIGGRNDRGIERLFKIVDQARDASRDAGILWKLCDLWWATLRRFEAGAEEQYLEIAEGLGDDVMQLAAPGFGELRAHFVDDGFMSDILGAVFMRCRHEWGGGWADQEFTPWNVCRMMAQMTVDELDTDRLESGPPMTVHDPACGAGAMLLAVQSLVAEKHGRRALYNLKCCGQDIDHLCCTMCRIQMRMTNVPWMLSFLAASFAEMGGKA